MNVSAAEWSGAQRVRRVACSGASPVYGSDTMQYKFKEETPNTVYLKRINSKQASKQIIQYPTHMFD
jgi:hypothetical protein